MEQDPGAPYALRPGEGWTYRYGIDFTVKAGELAQGRRVAIVEYTTRAGEEPPVHVHLTEDEIFYVLEGELTFRCGEGTFESAAGGFVLIPRGVEHTYQVRGQSEVRLLVVTAPAPDSAATGWGGRAADVETKGELRATPTAPA